MKANKGTTFKNPNSSFHGNIIAMLHARTVHMRLSAAAYATYIPTTALVRSVPIIIGTIYFSRDT
ncbi:uncharacterized protein Bfra_000445 [Botrytis fragariae]|uniref:Uncharacterized protein n=1 Tax=Botrytis fragariae TaxID=1964551 RepID=A0A8H6EN62_9HELO|nr:uncharacterized protein Bfra_000445 [Botrytis fragariae]KAF5878279.1 hypothetical protein Bfra_000445 [Botrytis fragariae]